MLKSLTLAGLLPLFAGVAYAQSDMPEAISAPGETTVLIAHADGAQIYQCRASGAAAPAWAYREPMATLTRGGETIGRHYAGPSWELNDSSVVEGEVIGHAPGATAAEIPWLRLRVVAHRGSGELSDVATVLRINTNGGMLAGTCAPEGATRAVAYSADYVFLKKK